MKEYSTEELVAIRNVQIKSYVQLIEELRFHKINPQEAYSIIANKKFKINGRHVWALVRIHMYLVTRLGEAITIIHHKVKNLKSNRASTSNVILKKTFIENILKNGLPMPKKRKSCEKTVKSKEFQKYFKINNPKTKCDLYKEATNLHKLVTERRHVKKFHKIHHSPIIGSVKIYGFNPKGQEQFVINSIR